MIYKIVEEAMNRRASDIHLTKDVPPKLRIDGRLEDIKGLENNDSEFLFQIMKSVLNESEEKVYRENKNIDLSKTYKDVRLRIHVFKQKGEIAFSIRLIPREIPKLDELNLPKILKEFTNMRNGLVLVTGTTGSGKSTTLAAIIDEINTHHEKHILTIEDPIEYIHNHKKSIVNQREIGQDVLSFSDAISSAMREDPDILLLGELRNLETIRSAITMAETGHLVFATVHTKSVPETVDRIIDVFPGAEQDQIRTQFANSIQGIITQELLPMKESGRVPCCEIMLVNNAIRNLIREKGNPSSIVDQIQMTSKKLGSQTRLQGLTRLVKKDLISIELAKKGLSDLELDNFYRLLNN